MPFPALANRFAIGAPGAIQAPYVPRIDCIRGYNGGAIGLEPRTVRSALCELLERSHFFALNRGRHGKTLSEAYERPTSSAFLHAIEQTADEAVAHNVAGHRFAMVPAINLLSGEDCFLPLVTVSLCNVADDLFLPYRDSSGCAAHYDPEHGLDGALLEFYERQCLVAAAMTGRCRSVIDGDSLGRVDGRLARLAQPLMMEGALRLAEIGFHRGAYVVLAAYEGRPGARVRYSVGCSASYDPGRAMEKALAEVQQGYLFFEFRERMRLEGRLPCGEDEYIDAENAPDTWRAFPFLGQRATLAPAEFCRLSHGSRGELLSELSAIGPNLIAYRGATQVEGRVMCFFKVVSPDYPLTRRIEHPYNVDNPFFKWLGVKGSRLRIPFY